MILEFIKDYGAVISVVVGAIAIYKQLSSQNSAHRIQTEAWRKEHKEDLLTWRKEHREDMRRRDAEVNTALQTLAAFAVRLDNLEKKKD